MTWRGIQIALFCFAVLGSWSAQAERPNIILIMADDMGYSDIGCYGGEIETPNLDRFASEGVRFREFYNASVCGQTRASLMTGLYHPLKNGIWTIPPRSITLFRPYQHSM